MARMQTVVMNNELGSSFLLLERIKKETGASYVRVSTSVFEGITIQIDWDDNCHTKKTFTNAEIVQADFDIASLLIQYANYAHEKLLKGEL